MNLEQKEIMFDEENHRYYSNSLQSYVSGVTRYIAKHLGKLYQDNPTLEQARQKGVEVHKQVEEWIKSSILPSDEEAIKVANLLRNNKNLHSEVICYDLSLEVASSVDIIDTKKKMLYDVKTGSVDIDYCQCQLSLYRDMLANTYPDIDWSKYSLAVISTKENKIIPMTYRECNLAQWIQDYNSPIVISDFTPDIGSKIDFCDYDFFKEALSQYVDAMSATIVTVDNRKLMEKQKMMLVHLRNAITKQSKAVIDEFQAPLKDYKKKIKELESLVSNGEDKISQGLEVFIAEERKMRTEFLWGLVLEQKAKKFFDKDFLPPKWYNKTAKVASILEDITEAKKPKGKKEKPLLSKSFSDVEKLLAFIEKKKGDIVNVTVEYF